MMRPFSAVIFVILMFLSSTPFRLSVFIVVSNPSFPTRRLSMMYDLEYRIILLSQECQLFACPTQQLYGPCLLDVSEICV